MTIDEALEINGRMVNAGLWNIGLPGRGAYPDLDGLTLLDMCVARDMVRDHDDAAAKGPGPHTFHTVCDDRLIAAIYCHAHYPVCQQDEDGIDSIISDGRKALVCIRVEP